MVKKDAAWWQDYRARKAKEREERLATEKAGLVVDDQPIYKSAEGSRLDVTRHERVLVLPADAAAAILEGVKTGSAEPWREYLARHK